MRGQLTFLGTGTSTGVPTLGCTCAVCQSSDPRNQRLRPSVAVRWPDASSPNGERVVLLDTGPDFRAQALREKINRVDAVFYTHGHADHIFGLDDLRPLSFLAQREGAPIPLFASEETATTLRRIYDYTFRPDATYPNRPRVELVPLHETQQVCGLELRRIPLMHGEMEIDGYRIGQVAYLTDVSAIPEASFALLEGLDHLILSALRHKPHVTHATVAQSLAWAEQIGARQTWFTHIAHDLNHAETESSLPANVRLAYDGLSFPIELS